MATGPSLVAEDVDWCRGKAPVIAVNDAYRLAPWADVLYACDARWWEAHGGVMDFQGDKYGLEHQAHHWGVTVLKQTGRRGIETNPAAVCTGGNSTYQALNVAVHLGARRVLLLGCDMAHWPGGPSHFFGEHPRKLHKGHAFEKWRDYFASAVEPLRALGITVVNCSRRTALECFPRQPLREALP